MICERRSIRFSGAASHSPTTVGVVFIAVGIEFVRDVRSRDAIVCFANSDVVPYGVKWGFIRIRMDGAERSLAGAHSDAPTE